MMRIVIPMAGQSERFRTAGYTVPKPFMTIDGVPMIHWVCNMFSSEDNFVFVVLAEHAADPRYREILEDAAPCASIVECEPNKVGPVYTSLLADSVVSDDEPVILAYSDFYQHWNYQQFLRTVDGYDGGVSVFKGYHPASFGDTYYAYLRCNGRKEMLELREKESFTDSRHEEPASTGVYYVRSWGTYRRLGEELMQKKFDVGGEFYVSLIYNLMIAQGMKVITHEVERFVCFGTPRDVEQYVFWSDYFRHDAARIAVTVASA